MRLVNTKLIIISHHDDDFALRKAVGTNNKGKLSMVLYAIGLLLSFVNTWVAIACYILVAIMWVIPDKRIENNIE
jgi:uncharacterized membrane protein